MTLALCVGVNGEARAQSAKPTAAAKDPGAALRAQAHQLFKQGKYVAAKDAFLRADKAGPSRGESLGMAAAAASWLGETAKSKELFLKAAAAAKNEKAYDNVQFFYGKLREIAADLPPDAKKKLEAASKVPEEPAAKAAAAQVQQTVGRVQQLRMAGNAAEAESAALQGVTVARAAFGAKHGLTLGIRAAWADTLLLGGRADECLAEYKSLTGDYTALVGADHPTTLVMLNGVASCLAKRGDAAEAEKIFEDVLQRTERARGKNHLLVAVALNNFGSFLLDRKQLDKALPILERAAGIDGGLGPQSPDRLATLNNLGTLHRLRGDKDKSNQVFEEALAGLSATRGFGDGQTQQLANMLVKLQTEDAGGGTDAKSLAESRVNRALLGRFDQPVEAMAAARKVNDSEQAFQQGNLAEAIRLGEEGLAMREKYPGRNRLGLATALNDVGTYYEAVGRFRESVAYHQRALELREKVPKNEVQVAQSLFNLGSVFNTMGDQAAALAPLERSIKLWVQTLGPNDPQIFRAEVRLAEVLAGLKRYQGLNQRLESIAKRSASAGAATEQALALMWLSSVQRDQGRLEEAEASAQGALRTASIVPGLGPSALATFRQALSSVLGDLGRSAEAARLDAEAVAAIELPQVPESQRIVVYYRAAQGAMARGDGQGAEPLLTKSLALAQKLLPPAHPDRLATHSLLGQLYSGDGRFELAIEHLRLALDGARKLWGDDNPNTAFVKKELAFNLAVTYQSGWEELFTSATAALEKSLGQAPATGDAHASLAYAAHIRGKHELAVTAADRAVAILSRIPGHPSLIPALGYRAMVLRSAGRLDEARRSADQALEALAPYGESSTLAALQDTVASIELQQGRTTEAIAAQRKSLRTIDRVSSQLMATGSEAKRVSLAYELSTIAWSCVLLHEKLSPSGAKEVNEAAKLALEGLLVGKSRALDAQATTLAAVRRANSPEANRLLVALGQLRERQVGLFSRQTSANEAPRQEAAKDLARQIEEIEKQLSAQAEGGAAFAPTTVERVQAALSSDALLIEFSLVGEMEEGGRSVPKLHYIAYTLDSSGNVGYANLGSAETLHEQIGAFRNALQNQRDVTTASRALYAATVGKLGSAIDGKKQLIVSPSGRLSLVPFEALLAPSEHFLIVDRVVSYVSTGRDLLRAQSAAQAPPGRAVVIANPAFGAAGTGEQKRGAAPGMGALQKAHWSALPGTGREATDVAPLLGDAIVLTGAQATEVAFKAVARPRILHVATHGFFLEAPAAATRGTRGLTLVSSTSSPPPDTVAPDAMLSSGLVFSGANQHASGADTDGYVTASELALMDLSGTKLVVLSACETGLGAASTGEGVFGLRRALALAGADSQVMSLWEVSDDATAALMSELYRGLRRGQGVSLALRAAQLGVMKEPRWQHPYYWAAFISSGRSADSITMPPAVAAPTSLPPRSGGCAACTIARDPGTSWQALAVSLLALGAFAKRRLCLAHADRFR